MAGPLRWTHTRDVLPTCSSPGLSYQTHTHQHTYTPTHTHTHTHSSLIHKKTHKKLLFSYWPRSSYGCGIVRLVNLDRQNGTSRSHPPNNTDEEPDSDVSRINLESLCCCCCFHSIRLHLCLKRHGASPWVETCRNLQINLRSIERL